MIAPIQHRYRATSQPHGGRMRGDISARFIIDSARTDSESYNSECWISALMQHDHGASPLTSPLYRRARGGHFATHFQGTTGGGGGAKTEMDQR